MVEKVRKFISKLFLRRRKFTSELFLSDLIVGVYLYTGTWVRLLMTPLIYSVKPTVF